MKIKVVQILHSIFPHIENWSGINKKTDKDSLIPIPNADLKEVLRESKLGSGPLIKCVASRGNQPKN